jgi:acetylornithine deacetylase/succinyl-diaminopimelate desuccinylase-like protein
MCFYTIAKAIVSKNTYLQSLLCGTISYTTIKTDGNVPNVIAGFACATLDCRLFPQTDVNAFINRIHHAINDDRVCMRVIKRTDSVKVSQSQSAFLDLLESTLRDQYPSAQIACYTSPIGSDAKYFRDHDVNAYGIIPFLLSVNDVRLMHGLMKKYQLTIFTMRFKSITWWQKNFAKVKGKING